MIPTFPTFKDVEYKDKNAIEHITHQFQPYSDFNFISLFSWDIEGKCKISILDGNLVILFSGYSSYDPKLSFLGTTNTLHTAHQLIEYASHIGISPILTLVPEASIENLHADDLTIVEEVDNFDYIYDIAKLALLEGEQFKSKRKALRKFENQFPHLTYKVCNPTLTHTKEQVVSVLDQWEANKRQSNKSYEIDNEKTAILRLLENAQETDVLFSGVFKEDAMLAFSIDELVSNNTAISHFMKTDVQYTGIGEFLNHEITKYLHEQQVAYWNWEQDLGLEHLKRIKMSYRPVNFLKKYSIASKTLSND